MTHAANDWLYFLLVLGVVLLPGLDMAFVLASLPQFVKPQFGQLVWQAVGLSAIAALTQAAVYGPIVWLAGRVPGRAGAGSVGGLVLARVVGAVLIAAAGFTGFEGWRAM